MGCWCAQLLLLVWVQEQKFPNIIENKNCLNYILKKKITSLKKNPSLKENMSISVIILLFKKHLNKLQWSQNQ